MHNKQYCYLYIFQISILPLNPIKLVRMNFLDPNFKIGGKKQNNSFVSHSSRGISSRLKINGLKFTSLDLDSNSIKNKFSHLEHNSRSAEENLPLITKLGLKQGW